MDVQTNQPYCPDSQNHRPDASLKNLKKRGKIAEKYFPNNFQNTHVYKVDIPVQLAFQKYTKI
jgi:hypothetical protein